MGVQIEPVPDERVKKILENPSDYYAKARERARAEVEREVARERGLLAKQSCRRWKNPSP